MDSLDKKNLDKRARSLWASPRYIKCLKKDQNETIGYQSVKLQLARTLLLDNTNRCTAIKYKTFGKEVGLLLPYASTTVHMHSQATLQ